MKANIFEIKRFAVHDGDGIRTTVFFKGCPLSCVWCHNPEGIFQKPQLAYYPHKCIGCGECFNTCPRQTHSFENGNHILKRENCTACGECAGECLGNALTIYGQEKTVDELFELVMQDKEFYENSDGGVTLSGGECLLQADACAVLLQKLKSVNVHTAVDTCGFISKTALDKVIPYTDIFLYDLKAIDEKTHIRCTGQSNTVILENLLYLDRLGVKTEIRIPFVPDYNDGEIEKMGEFLANLKHVTKVRVLAYHNFAGSKYQSLDMPNTMPERLPTEKELERAKTILKSFALQVE
jgi:pyruvate formate lyase activating enzyme